MSRTTSSRGRGSFGTATGWILGACVALALAAPARADLIEVGFGTGNTHIQDAIDVAQDGDVILAQEVTYEYTSFEIVNKSLTILSEGPLPIVGHVVVRDLEAGKRVVLKNLVVDPFFDEHPLRVLDCEGAVVLEGSTFRAPHGSGAVLHGALVSNSTAVSFSTSRLVGGSAPFCAHPALCPTLAAGHGLRAVGSRVSLEACQLEGGHGLDHGSAADGLSTAASVVHASGTQITRGETGVDGLGGALGTHGLGVHATAGGKLRLRDCDVHGAVVADAQQVESVDTPSSGVALPGPVRPGEAFDVSVRGPAGATAQLWLSLDAGWRDFPKFEGVLLLAPPFLLNHPLQLGVLTEPSASPIRVTLKDIGGLDSLVVHGQLVTIDGIDVRLGARSTLVLVDDQP